MPPLFTCSEREPSAIDGHEGGHQREGHWNSRLQSLDFAAEAHRARVEAAAARKAAQLAAEAKTRLAAQQAKLLAKQQKQAEKQAVT